jgi:hypothetical protein
MSKKNTRISLTGPKPDAAMARAARAKVKASSPIAGMRVDHDDRTTELLTMLRTMRPAKSAAEAGFVAQWVAPLGTTPDPYGNHWLTIGDSRILWSCHTDTVHARGGVQYVGHQDGCAYVTRSNCLGADDTTGVWLMRHMVLAGVAGTYVFHRSEECGGLGSRWIADKTPDRLSGIDFAIAFDRMGYCDIITDQMGTTASNTFAHSLASALAPLDYEPADGVFTDTQHYAEIIPECSNISVGYHKQHTAGEWQDVDYAMILLNVLTTADFSGLKAARDPYAPSLWDRWETRRSWDLSRDDADITLAREIMTIDDFVKAHPEAVSDLLSSLGYDLAELRRYAGLG